ncbi:hypothetical protein GGS23DRAFT_357121 [Durotheca rogersii]|uniref:uncharacterized protein n=1 Tax=Durotheca rogersii TaxID=419775 RepID=UPI00221EBC2B|nr:uncharacterized protein GGS23DRAFT_357121 [Durotheca rogersii]KAI5865847.1 hypothetical protein GGS23DRAFT_357121 [Durotheca rogersii]
MPFSTLASSRAAAAATVATTTVTTTATPSTLASIAVAAAVVLPAAYLAYLQRSVARRTVAAGCRLAPPEALTELVGSCVAPSHPPAPNAKGAAERDANDDGGNYEDTGGADTSGPGALTRGLIPPTVLIAPSHYVVTRERVTSRPVGTGALRAEFGFAARPAHRRARSPGDEGEGGVRRPGGQDDDDDNDDDEEADERLLRSYLSATMCAFARTPQARVMRRMGMSSLLQKEDNEEGEKDAGDENNNNRSEGEEGEYREREVTAKAREREGQMFARSFEDAYLSACEFAVGDRVCGVYVVSARRRERCRLKEGTGTARGEGPRTMTTTRAVLRLEPPTGWTGPVVRGALDVGFDRAAAEATVVFVNETVLWRERGREGPTMLEGWAGRWLHEVLARWLVVKGVEAVTARGGTRTGREESGTKAKRE